MLWVPTRDGANKRRADLKPPWYLDDAHLPAVFSHLNNYMHGELKDRDSGEHPFVHMAWRALAIAGKETGRAPS